MGDDLVRIDRCPLCFGHQLRRHAQRRDGIWVRLCEECGHGAVEAHPRDLGALYQRSYYEKSEETGFGYVGYDHSDADYLAWAAALVALSGASGSLFDLGCTNGIFLDRAHALGFHVLAGVELNEEYAALARAKGYAVHAGSFLDMPAAFDGPHDVVTAWASLEHLADLDGAMARIRRMLKPEGLLFFEVPCLVFDAERDRPWMESSLEHLHYFTEKSVAALGRKYFGQAPAGRVVRFDRFGSSFVGFVGSRLTESAATIANRLTTIADDELSRLSLDELRCYLFLHLLQLGDGEQACRLADEIARRDLARTSLETSVTASLVKRYVKASSDLAKYIEANDYFRQQASERAEANVRLRAQANEQATELAALRAENELNRKSKALRMAQIASESRRDLRLLPRAPFRVAGVLVPERAQARVRATVASGRQWLQRARQVTRTNTRWPDDRPLVSVVIPCFNYGHYVETAIDSVLNQTWKDLEIIVVDGGSTDGTTVERLRALDKPKTRVHFRSGRHLVGDNRNFGIGLARGKYICCLDADDILAPTYLEKAVFLAEAYAYDLVFPSVRCFGEKNDLWMVTDPTVESCRVANGISTVGLFRREAWEKVGGYRDWGLGAEHVPEDWDFWLRLLGHGFRAKSIREPLMYYRVHGHGLTGTATMDVKSQAAKIEEANQQLRSLRLRMAVAFARKAQYVVDHPTVNLCRMSNTTPRTLVALAAAGRSELDALGARLSAPGRALTIVTTADSPIDAEDEAATYQPNGTEVFHLPWFLDDAERRDRFLLYLLESRAVDALRIEGSEEARRLLPQISDRFPKLRIL